MSLALLPVSSLALLLSAASLAVFLRAPRRRATDFRCSLGALTVTLCLYLLCANLDFANVLCGACMHWSRPQAHSQVLLAGIVCCLGDSFLSLRNWCNVLITAQRAEALIRPLRRTKLLRRRNFLACLATFWLAGLALSVVRSLAEVFVVCEDGRGGVYGHIGLPGEGFEPGTVVGQEVSPYRLLMNYAWFKSFEVYGYFVYQTAAPVLLVLVFTGAMVARMLYRRRRHSSGPTGGVGGGCGGGGIHGNDDRLQGGRRNRLNASRTVLCMAMVFTALHSPAFVGTALQQFHAGFDVTSGLGKAFQFCVDLCVLLDSVCNLCVYARFVPEFRQACVGRITGGGNRNLTDRGAGEQQVAGTERIRLRRMTYG